MFALRNLFKHKTTTREPETADRSYWHILHANLFSFFNLILFSVGVILMIFGRYSDAFITVSAGVAGTLVNAFHEVRAKRQLDQITLLVRPTARIIRNGQEQTVDAAQIVAGDSIQLRPGDQALADGVVDKGQGELDEALLTGESDPVRKQPGDTIFSGSFCLNGALVYRANAVGAESFASKLTVAARHFTQVTTPLQQQIALAIRLLMVLTVFMALVFYIAGFIRNLDFLQNVAASAVLIGLIPYGLFLTINLAYTLGAVRIARQGAVVQHTNAVEALHYVDVLCLDKTGTLTTNALQLQTVLPLGNRDEAAVRQLLGDFVHSATTANATTNAIRQGIEGRQHPLTDEAPFVSARKWSALTFDDGERHGLFVLGALEMLEPYLPPEALVRLNGAAQAWSEQGLRVLIFAHNPNVTQLHNGDGVLSLPPLEPLGLLSLRDELRPHAGEILQAFTELGVRLKIISGDNPHTVAALVKQTGLVNPKLISGPELAAMSAAQFEEAAAAASIFGRIAPEQKAQLVEALLKRGHYVAMVGDGVNDILALKKAKLGIAMQSGSSATRNVADMVLLGDSYAALAPALSESKRIINGLTNATHLLLARSLTYAFVIIGVLMVGLDFPFEPSQAGVTAITVGLPSFFLTLWARATAKEEPLLRSLVRFVFPVALWSMLIGVALFTFVYFRTSSIFEDAAITSQVIARFERNTGLTYQAGEEFGLTAARIVAQTALSTFLTFGALLLLIFLEPPIAFFAGLRPVSPDWRPTLLALGLIVLFVISLYTPLVADYLGFVRLFRPVWRDVLVSLVIWFMGLWLLWRRRWLDQLLAVGN